MLSGFLDEVGSTRSVPAGGSVAAAAVAMASALLVKVAKLSREQWTEAEADAAAAAAEALRERGAGLAEADADAYRALQAAWRASRAAEGETQNEVLGQARARVVEVPLAIVRTGAEVTELAEKLAAHGNPRLRADALIAAVLAAAATEAAASLVAINLARDLNNPGLAEAQAIAQAARARARTLWHP